MSFIPDAAVLVTFSVAAALLTLTPGPDMTLFLGKAVSGGRRAGLAAYTGAMTGLLAHTLFAAFGLSALLAASPTAFLVLKVVGALYLLWLAFQALRTGSGLTLDPETGKAEPLATVFVTGFGINLLNPKIILFFVTFLPQFVSPGDPAAAGKLFFLGMMFIAIAMPICVALILVADRISLFVRRSRWVTRSLDYAFAGVMGGFAVKLLATRAG